MICSYVIPNKGNERDFDLNSGQITDSTGKSYGLRGAEIGGAKFTYSYKVLIAPDGQILPPFYVVEIIA